ncbi:SUKH-4 family immunity protein [Streptomyces sp. NPDC003035]|uniref:SUKH-4 family immunity protein n=1 Tax=Streptomyces sp. NPDC003035 TaxID=3364676 RepID=UPI0036932999
MRMDVRFWCQAHHAGRTGPCVGGGAYGGHRKDHGTAPWGIHVRDRRRRAPARAPSVPHARAEADRLICLGSLIHDFEVVIDGRTGLLSYRSYDDAATTPVNADVSTLAFTIWMFSREQRLDEEPGFTRDFYHQLADTMIEVLASVDPVACLPSTGEDDYRYWPGVFHDEAGGVL